MELPKPKEITIAVGKDRRERVGMVVSSGAGHSSPMVMLIPADDDQRERLFEIVRDDQVRAGVEAQVKKVGRWRRRPLVAVGPVPKQKV